MKNLIQYINNFISKKYQNYNKALFSYIKIIIYGTIIITVIFFLYLERNRLLILADVSRYKLCALFTISLLPAFLNALSFKINISIFDFNLKFKEWFGLSVINSFYNYILPVRSGMTVRIGYMKKKYDFPVSNYLSFLTGSYLLSFFTSAITASAISICLYFSTQTFKAGLLYLSLGLLLITLFFLFFLFSIKSAPAVGENKITRFLQNLLNSLQVFKLNKNKIKYLVLCKFFFIIATSLRLYTSYWILGIDISYLNLLLVCSFFVFSMFISIAPGNLGIKEGIIGLFTSLMGLSVKDAMLGAILDRVVEMMLIFILGILFHYFLFKKRETTEF